MDDLIEIIKKASDKLGDSDKFYILSIFQEKLWEDHKVSVGFKESGDSDVYTIEFEAMPIGWIMLVEGGLEIRLNHPEYRVKERFDFADPKFDPNDIINAIKKVCQSLDPEIKKL